jgi:hypothetical protein
VADPLVKFRRTRGMLPLPYPVPGGTLEDLRLFTNIPAESEADWVLFKAWLHQALRPRGPYPVLILHGEQGTAKSTQARLARALIFQDPTIPFTRFCVRLFSNTQLRSSPWDRGILRRDRRRTMDVCTSSGSLPEAVLGQWG